MKLKVYTLLTFIFLLHLNLSAQLFDRNKRNQGNGSLILSNGNLYIGDFSYEKKGLIARIDSSTIIRNGKGSTFHGNTSNIFQYGYYVNDTLEGEAVVTDSSGQNQYTGKFVKGKITGTVKHQLRGRLRYIGSMNDLRYESDGILYDSTGKISYEGQFSNGKFSGKGKYWKNDKIQYSGEWNDGLPDGKGIEYLNNYKYEGDFAKGERKGKGILTNLRDYSKYVGEFASNLPDGEGIYYDGENKKIYTGNFKDGFYHGKGITYDNNEKVKYEGEFFNNAAEGYGKVYFEDGKLQYEGDFKNNKPEGKGKQYNGYGNLIYEGGFVQSKYEGDGKEYDENGKIIYSGYFKQNLLNGYGFKYYDNGEIEYMGFFTTGVFDGVGTHFLRADKGRGATDYDGNYKDGYYSGQGILYYTNGKIKYNGLFLGGLFDGNGSIYNERGLKVYEGEFKEGQRNGMGVSFLTTGKPDKDGLWTNDVFVKSKKQIDEEQFADSSEKTKNSNDSYGLTGDIKKAIDGLSDSEKNYMNQLLKSNADPQNKLGRRCGTAYTNCKWCGKSIAYDKVVESSIQTLKNLTNPLYSIFAELGIMFSSSFSGKDPVIETRKAIRGLLRDIKDGKIYFCNESSKPGFCSKKCEFENKMSR